MKKCDLCNKEDVIHYRVKSINTKVGFFAASNVGILFLKKANILMVVQENKNNLHNFLQLLILVSFNKFKCKIKVLKR